MSENELGAPASAERFQAFVDRHGYLSWLDVDVADVEEGYVEMHVPFDEALVNPFPEGYERVHGGVAATLVDTASGFALRTTFADPAEAELTTTDLDVSYLRPVSDDLVATAEVVRAGGSMGVVDVTVESRKPDGEWTEVAVGRASYRLFR